jgi:ribosomal protein S18 acetylase RimI-like enzyme
MGGQTGQNYPDKLIMQTNNTKSFTIRPLAIRDLPQVAAIQETITKKKVSPAKRAVLKEQITKEGNISLVAIAEKKVVGYVISEVMTNSFGLDQSGWVKNLGVLPKYMGKGMGQDLANQLFEAYRKRGITEIFTACRWDWGDMLSFFKSLGFDRSGFINLYKKLDD